MANENPSDPSDHDGSERTAADKSHSQDAFPVVGIGASAGGLDAFKRLFAVMPPDTGMAFVLVPHLDPSHKSLMTELLAKYTPLPVCEAGDGMTLQPDRVYIIPPNHYLSLDGPRLRLEAPPHAHGPQTAIDHFLRSLAEEWGELAVGILLSGTGSHGSLGLREIKGRGGLTLVQEPTEAAYGQMPRSAAADGSVDYILPVADMPEVLLRHARRLARGKGAREQAQEHGANGQLGQILALLRARTQYDFRCYRKRMLMRRVQRRMGLARLERLTDYLARLRDDAAEVNALFKDLLIGVTSFFREPDAFRLLEQRVLNTLVEHCDNDSPLRVWVPACSSGEEAYSIAMLLIESCERHNRPCAIQVFATDIDEDALAFARQGLYPAGIKADLSPARLNRFFGRSGDAHYQVSKQLRETVVFAAQNLVSDAPFSRLDLISCRNLMIYMEPEVQGKLIALFHFALKPEGFLFLGPSETISRQADLFETLSKKWRIFRRIGPPRRDLLEFPLGNGGARIAQPPQLQDAGGPAPLPDFGDLTRRLLLDAFAPATLLVNRRLEILYFHGPTVQYLELPTGAPTRDLIEMAREGLRTRLRAACHRALREKQPVRVVDARVKRDGVFHPVELSVTPVHEPKGAEGMLLVSFFERPPRAGDDAASGTDELLGDETAAIQQLEQELKTTREDLQSTIEEMESANEELKASNEEVMSMNEELQSANEELETSKEELQSLNEELSTVNNQLQDKVEELERTGNDIANLLANTELAVIFLDNQFRIKRFTPATARLLNLLESDIGRQLADFAPKFSDEFLLEDAGTVLRTLAATEKEVSNTAGQVYLRRIQPYRTADDRIEGVAVTFVEITRRKQMEAKLEELNRALMKDVDERTAELQRREREFRILADNVPTLFAYIDSRRRYRYVNRHYAELYGRSADELIGRPVKEVIGQKLYQEIRPHMDSALSGNVERFDLHLPALRGGLDGQVTQVPDVGDDGTIDGYFMVVEDITERKRAETALYARERHLQSILDTAAEAIVTVDREGRLAEFNQAAANLFGYRADEARGMPAGRIFYPSDDAAPQPFQDCFDLAGDGAMRHLEILGQRKDGSHFPLELSAARMDHLDLCVGLMRDLSEHKSLEREVIEVSTLEQERIGRDIHDGLGQQITGVTMLAASLLQHLEQGQMSREAQIARTLVTHLDGLLVEAKTLAQGLVPVPVGPGGLSDALSLLAERIEGTSGIQCRFHTSGGARALDPSVATQLYRIAQEAMNNAIKHAEPGRVDLRLEETAEQIVLSVCDDGKGIQKETGRTDKLGLHLMRYRAGIMGAALSIEPGPEGGTEVKCILPLRR